MVQWWWLGQASYIQATLLYTATASLQELAHLLPYTITQHKVQDKGGSKSDPVLYFKLFIH